MRTGRDKWLSRARKRGGHGWRFAEHRTYDALRLLQLAADPEDAAEKNSVTPGAIRPARELLGDLLMEMHQPKEALFAYGRC